jgi:hypothetical protein
VRPRVRGGGNAPVRGPLEVGERPRGPAADPPRAPVVRRDIRQRRLTHRRLSRLVRAPLLARVPLLLGALPLEARRLLARRLLALRLFAREGVLARGGARPGVAPPAQKHLGEGNKRRVGRSVRRPRGQIGREEPAAVPIEKIFDRVRALECPARVFVDPRHVSERRGVVTAVAFRRRGRRPLARVRATLDSVVVVHVGVARDASPAVGVFRLALQRAAHERARALHKPRGLRGVEPRRLRGGQRGSQAGAERAALAAEPADARLIRPGTRDGNLGRGDLQTAAVCPLSSAAGARGGAAPSALHGQLPHRVAGLDRGQRHRVGIHRIRKRRAGAERRAERTELGVRVLEPHGAVPLDGLRGSGHAARQRCAQHGSAAEPAAAAAATTEHDASQPDARGLARPRCAGAEREVRAPPGGAAEPTAAPSSHGEAPASVGPRGLRARAGAARCRRHPGGSRSRQRRRAGPRRDAVPVPPPPERPVEPRARAPVPQQRASAAVTAAARVRGQRHGERGAFSWNAARRSSVASVGGPAVRTAVYAMIRAGDVALVFAPSRLSSLRLVPTAGAVLVPPTRRVPRERGVGGHLRFVFVTKAVRVRGQKRKRRAENVFGGGKEDAGVESAENDRRENVELRSSGERRMRFSTRALDLRRSSVRGDRVRDGGRGEGRDVPLEPRLSRPSRRRRW